MNNPEEFYTSVVRNDKGKERAEGSWIESLRLLNNFAKAYALALFTNTNLPVACFDYSCGKGGDYFKLTRLFPSMIKYVGMDITEKSIQDFRERLSTSASASNNNNTHVSVYDLRNLIHEAQYQGAFTLVNMGFCFHYFWESPEILDNCIKNVSNLLISKGRCIITTVNENKVKSRLNPKNNEIRIINQDNHLVCRFKYKQDYIQHGYLFELNDSLHEKAVSAVEYFVNHTELERVCKEHHLSVIHNQSLLQFIQSGVGHSLYELMGVPKEIGPVEESILDLYEVIILEKQEIMHLPTDTSGYAYNIIEENAFAFDDDYQQKSPPYGTSPSYGTCSYLDF